MKTPEKSEPAQPLSVPLERPASRLWVWEDVLTDHPSGMVCVLAPDEATAWDLLKEKDSLAWWVMRGRPDDREDKRSPNELNSMFRPRCVDQPEAFVAWGGE